MNTDWMARGKCKEVAPDIFFPNDGMGVLVAQRICAECPVSEPPAWSTRSSTTSTTGSGAVRRSVSAAASCAVADSPTPSSSSSNSPGAATPRAPPCSRRRVPDRHACHAGAVIVECVVNVSEGRDDDVLGQLAAAAGPTLLHLHRDPDHNRSVLTLAGPAEAVAEAARSLAAATVARLDLREHAGAHPRLGVLDVVPFVPYEPGGPPPDDLSAAVVLRDEFARWLGAELGVPSFLYGPLPGGRARTLPDVRRARVRRRRGGRPDPRLRAARCPTPAPAPPPSAPDRCSWPTTCGSPRSRWPGGWRRWCAAPRCAPWAWPSGRGPRCRAT